MDQAPRFPQCFASAAESDCSEVKQMQEEAVWIQRMRKLVENEHYDNEVAKQFTFFFNAKSN